MEISILETYDDQNFSLRISSLVKQEFCRVISEFGVSEEHRKSNQIGANIRIYVNGHSIDDNDNVCIRNKTFFLKNKSIFECFVSLPTDAIKKSEHKIKTWIHLMLLALKLVEQKSGVKFAALCAKEAVIETLYNEFLSDEKYRFDNSVHDPDDPAVIVL